MSGSSSSSDLAKFSSGNIFDRYREEHSFLFEGARVEFASDAYITSDSKEEGSDRKVAGRINTITILATDSEKRNRVIKKLKLPLEEEVKASP